MLDANFQALQLQFHIREELQLAHSSLGRKEEEQRKVKVELHTLRKSKAEADELVLTLTNECTTLRAKVVAFQEELKIADEIRLGMNVP